MNRMRRDREIAMFARLNGASARFYNPYGDKVVRIPIDKAFAARAKYGANPKYPKEVAAYMCAENIVDDNERHRAVTPQGYVDALVLAIKDPKPRVPVIAIRSMDDFGEGKHRILAAKQAGLKTVPVVFIDNYDEISPRSLESLESEARKYSSVEDFVAAMIPSQVFWHGSPSGDLRGGLTGLHLGTKLAATEALEARIGVPAVGGWDGSREYGKTLLAGKKSIRERIRKDGVKEMPPIAVIEDEDYDGKPYYRLEDGNHRLVALYLEGIREFPALIFHNKRKIFRMPNKPEVH